MADQKISQLSDGSPAQGADDVVVARSGANYKLPLSSLYGNLPSTGTSGAPVSGTWATDQLALDSSNRVWLCTSGGTPGTWAFLRPTSRINSITSSATPAINTDTTDIFEITALAVAITSMTTNLTGTPHDGDSLIVRITDNATPQSITWGASFEASTIALPTTTVASTLLTVGFFWNAVTSKWRCVASA